MILNVITALIVFGMFFVFNYFIWNEPNSQIVLLKIVLPSYGTTLIMAVPVYFLIRILSERFGLDNGRELKEAAEEAADDED